MQFINYFLASLISFFGLILGMILVSIAPEEQKPGRKYFIFLQNLFFVLSLVFFLVFLKVNIFLVFLLIILSIFYFSKAKIKDYFKKSGLIYAVLAFTFFLSSKDTNLFLIGALFIILFGMATGSLLLDRRKKNYLKVISSGIIFLALTQLLFLLNYHFSFLIFK